MSDADEYRRRAERLLSRAAQAENMAERGRLIDEALHWHNLALEMSGHHNFRLNDNEDGDAESMASGG
jgi:hypothetical protein